MRTAVVALGLLLVGGCGAPVSRAAAPAASVTQSLRVGPLLVPGAASITDASASDPRCATTIHRFRTLTGDYAAVALAPGCVGTSNTPENGDHGYYPQPPPASVTQQASTPVGTATLFTNQYAECTSSCYIGSDEVALVSVDGTVVQIVAVTAPASGTTDRRRPDLVALLQTLRQS